MCDCATELERKRREIEQRSGLNVKSETVSRASSYSSRSLVSSGQVPGSGGDADDGSPGLLRAFMMFLRGEMSLREVGQEAGFSGALTDNLGVVGGLVGGGVLLAMLAMLSKVHGGSTSWNFNITNLTKWRKPSPEINCIPKPDPGQGPPKINKERLKWPQEEDEN